MCKTKAEKQVEIAHNESQFEKRGSAFEYVIEAVTLVPNDKSSGTAQEPDKEEHKFLRDEENEYDLESAIKSAGGPLEITDTTILNEEWIKMKINNC